MSVLNRTFEAVHQLFPAKVAHAHCDIPCGIYDPHQAQIAALTVIRMNQLIDDLSSPETGASTEERQTYTSKMGRYIASKEEHAELCKRELRIIWADYFTPAHLEKNPDLHNHFWNAMKVASKARQNVDMNAATELLSSVHAIAEIFWKTKGAETRRRASGHVVGGEVVYPV